MHDTQNICEYVSLRACHSLEKKNITFKVCTTLRIVVNMYLLEHAILLREKNITFKICMFFAVYTQNICDVYLE